MAGYSGYSMSNNARNAYACGRVPASKIGHGIPAALVSKFCLPNEWHHTSSHYNSTNFYDAEETLAIFGIAETEDYPFSEYRSDAAVAALAEYKNKSKTAHGGITYRANVRWIEWSGTRNYPHAEKHELKNVEVTEKGQFYTIHTPSGDVRKKIGSNGTSVERL